MRYTQKDNNNLPFDIKCYFDFLEGENPISNWHGVSIQVKGSDERNIDLQNAYLLESLFKDIISILSGNTSWIVNHHYKDWAWFPDNGGHDLTALRALFKNNKVSDTFKGSLIFTGHELSGIAKDLILYPYTLSSQDLDILHTSKPIIIKTTAAPDFRIV